MQLEHTFTVPVGIEQAWRVLLDIERIAPCMPGAALETVEGDAFTGSVKVRLGPIGLTYKGKASFIEKDEAAHRAIIDAQGKDARGNGTAAAKVTATLTSEGDASTSVLVVTDLNITGKPAQFGRGVMVDVGNKLIGQFADCLAGKLASGDEPATVGGSAIAGAPDTAAPVDSPVVDSPTTPSSASSAFTATDAQAASPVRRVTPAAQGVEPIDLLGSAGPAVAKRLVPLVAALVVMLVAGVLRRRMHRR